MDNCSCCYISVAVLTTVVLLYVIRKWCRGRRCHSKSRLDGRTVVITGANTGIGLETAIDMAKRGAIVVMACRDVKRGESALKQVKERSGSSNVHLKTLDLASLASVREFAKSFLAEYDKLHILINNAAVMACPYMKTEDSFEMQIGVNHFGHFALANLLLKRMVESAPGRIVTVSSRAQKRGNINFDDINSEKGYSRFRAYAQSKLANVLFTKELNRKIEHTGVTAYTLHPGVIATEIGRHLPCVWLFYVVFAWLLWLVQKSPEEGAQTSIYCAVEEGIEHQSGMYFSDCAVKNSSKQSCDEGIAKKLWDISEKLTAVKFPL